MSRSRILLVSILTIGLIAGIGIPAMASSGNSSTVVNTVPSSEAEMVSALEAIEAEAECDEPDLESILEQEGITTDDCTGLLEEEINDLKVLPRPWRLGIAGGFHGDWSLCTRDDNAPEGKLNGVYGYRNHCKCGTIVFRGMWKTDDGEVTGYLVGKGINGRLHGAWYWPEKGMGGRIKGTYTPVVRDATTDSEMSFEGEWYLRGKPIVSMEGNWSPAKDVITSKRFEGEYSRCEDTPSDGIIKGVHGRVELDRKSVV